jgi:hypothetical protein
MKPFQGRAPRAMLGWGGGGGGAPVRGEPPVQGLGAKGVSGSNLKRIGCGFPPRGLGEGALFNGSQILVNFMVPERTFLSGRLTHCTCVSLYDIWNSCLRSCLCALCNCLYVYKAFVYVYKAFVPKHF